LNHGRDEREKERKKRVLEKKTSWFTATERRERERERERDQGEARREQWIPSISIQAAAV